MNKDIKKLIYIFKFFLGIGLKMAERIAFYILNLDENKLKFILRFYL